MINRNFEKNDPKERISFCKAIYLILLEIKNDNLIAGLTFVHPNKIHIKRYPKGLETVGQTFVIVVFDDRKLFNTKNKKFRPTVDLVIDLTDLQKRAVNSRGRLERRLKKFILGLVFEKLEIAQTA